MTKGSFCNGNSTEPCPIGYYRDLEGGMTVDDCFKCPAGKYCNSLGLDKSAESLDLCPKGYYCDGYDVSTDSTMKKPCGEHYYCPEGSLKIQYKLKTVIWVTIVARKLVDLVNLVRLVRILRPVMVK